MATIKLEKPQPRQIEFMQQTARFVGYGGARGGGKSWALRAKLIGMCCKYSGLRCLIIRKSYKELLDNHINQIKAILAECIAEKKVRYDSEQHRFEFWNGSSINCGYCACQSDLEQYQGIDYDIIALDEATNYEEEVFLKLGACLRGRVHLPKRFYLTCNPGGVGHEWVKRLFITKEYKPDEDPNDFVFVKALATDNDYNGKEYMKMLNQLPEPLRSAWRDGNWETFVGQYFPEWDLEKLEIKQTEIPEHWNISMSIDYGLDCFAPIWYGTDENGIDYLIKEYSAKDTIIPEAARLIKEIENGLGIDGRRIKRYAPPDLWNRKSDTGLSTIDMFRQCDLNFIKADNNREAGWMAVKTRLAQNKLKIFQGRGNQLSYCMRLLQHDEVRVNDVAKNPHDITHLPDSLRYFCIMRTQKAKITPVRTSANIIDQRGSTVVRRSGFRVNLSGLKGGLQ